MMRSRLKEMLRKFFRSPNRSGEIFPDEILLDAENLPQFDQSQFEGRLEKPIGSRTVVLSGLFFGLVIIFFVGKISLLQIRDGQVYAEKSSRNTLRQSIVFADRGVIYDRNKVLLASNTYDASGEFPRRIYAPLAGLAHILGYLRYPAKDVNGFYYQDRAEGLGGVESIYDRELGGTTGLKIVETNALGRVESESVIEPPQDGQSLTLSVDSRVQHKLYELLKERAADNGFEGGAAALMDIETGELVAAASFPEYDSNVMSEHTDTTAIKAFVESKRKPFLYRVTDGLYTPGSIIKPFIALAALHENVIDPKTKILSTGSISIANPFAPEKRSVFRDWKAHGYVDMREALAVSSDVYFYEIGGGFESQRGLGIGKIGEYMRLFGFGRTEAENSLLDKEGAIPSPEWKAENFAGDPWRIGDTYNTSIGQYGFQVTPLQALRAVASVANGGTLIEPTLLHLELVSVPQNKVAILPFSEEEMRVVEEGMRQAVLSGTAKGLDIPEVSIAAKTGTAELGAAKKYVNSWIIGFLPYGKPRFAFVAIMEKGPYENTIGALYVMRHLFEWMAANTPEYLR